MTIFAVRTAISRTFDISDAHAAAAHIIADYLCGRVGEITSAFAPVDPKPGAAEPEAILRTLLAAPFNYQAKGRVAHLTGDVLSRIRCAVQGQGELRFFLLFHGGYRSDPLVGERAVTFETDLTELMLLYQVARFKRALPEACANAFRFTIVINNGVAAVTNEIPYADTQRYVERLRAMIGRLGASAFVDVLVQSEIDMRGFDMAVHSTAVESSNRAQPLITPALHGIVERFLGRTCSIDEASRRATLYGHAEAEWGQTIRMIADEANGIILRQVASFACLSFRPFPGGAIRVQNGTLGFRIADGRVTPTLITSETVRSGSVDTLSLAQVGIHSDRLMWLLDSFEPALS